MAISALWVGEAAKFTGPPSPSIPLGVPSDPFVGPGIVADPIGGYEPDPYYTGPGAFRCLKTGVYALSFGLQLQFNVLPGPSDPGAWFELWAEDGVNQKARAEEPHGNRTMPHGGTSWALFTADKQEYGATAIFTVVETERIADAPVGTFTSYPGQMQMEMGLIPLGWDCYFILRCVTLAGDGDLSDLAGRPHGR